MLYVERWTQWEKRLGSWKGQAGLASPRWSCSYEDALGRTVCETCPGFRGALLVTSNEYNTANQLIATRSYAVPVTSSPSPLTFTLICYNSLGQRTLTVSDMNLNSQIWDPDQHTVEGAIADVKSNLRGLLAAFNGKDCECENKKWNP